MTQDDYGALVTQDEYAREDDEFQNDVPDVPDEREPEDEERALPEDKAAPNADQLFDADPEEPWRARRSRGRVRAWPDRGTAGSDADLEEKIVWALQDEMRRAEIESDPDLVRRADGTYIRRGAPAVAGGSKRGPMGGRRAFSGSLVQEVGALSLVAQLRRPSPAFLVWLFGVNFSGRQEDALRSVRPLPGRPSNRERQLRADVIEFANLFHGRGSRKLLADFFGVSVSAISAWRREAREAQKVSGKPHTSTPTVGRKHSTSTSKGDQP